MSGAGNLEPGADGTSAPPDVRDALADLAAARPDIHVTVQWHARLPSTMDAVSAAADRGAAAGLVVVAEQQTAGRGRRGHAWLSPPGAGLYFSYLARPTRDVGLITLAAGVAVRGGIEQATGLAPELKWPNDLLVGRRKLAGLLAEGVRLGTADPAVVVGVGINLQPGAFPPEVDARATSIDAETGRATEPGVVLASVLEHLHDTLASLERGNAGDILNRWRLASPSAAGTPVEWDEGGRTRRGSTAGIDDHGALLVQTSAGLERIVGGSVRWFLR